MAGLREQAINLGLCFKAADSKNHRSGQDTSGCVAYYDTSIGEVSIPVGRGGSTVTGMLMDTFERIADAFRGAQGPDPLVEMAETLEGHNLEEGASVAFPALR